MSAIQKGILLKRIDYGETSLILQFYTLEKGFQTYIFRGGKKKNRNILQAMEIVEIKTYDGISSNNNLSKITSIQPIFVSQTLHYNPLKTGLMFFMAEILSQVLRNSNEDAKMFDFLQREIIWIDHSDELTSYPIWFLLKLSETLGIKTHIEDKNGMFFNFKYGEITNNTPTTPFFVKSKVVVLLAELMCCEKNELLSKSINKNIRREIILILIDYLKFHISNLKTPKSLSVLRTVFD